MRRALCFFFVLRPGFSTASHHEGEHVDEDPGASQRNGTAPEREASHRALHTIVQSVQCCAANVVIVVTYHVISDATRKRAGTPCRSIRDESRGRAADFGRRRVDHAVVDALRNWSCIVSLLQFLVQWSIMMIVRVLLPALLYGLLVPFPRGAGFLMLCVIMLCCLAQLFYLDL